MKRTWFAWMAPSVALLLSPGCARQPAQPPDWSETVTQVSSYAALAAGRYDGHVTCAELLQFGDTGLGTFDGLDGEMIVLEGRIHRVDADGAVSEPAPSTLVPFADVTWFEPDLVFDVSAMDQQVFQNTMRWKRPDPDHAYAIRVKGVFRSLTIRSVPKQEKPYPPLDQVVPALQRVFEHAGIEGTLVGFLLPDEVGTLMPAGFHLHFVSSDRKAGGHVLDFDLAQGRIELDQTPTLQVMLRTGD